MIVALLGQSNARKFQDVVDAPATPNANVSLWNGTAWSTPSGDGLIELGNKLAEATSEPIRILNCAVNDSAMIPANVTPSTNCWSDTSASSPFSAFLNTVDAIGAFPDYMVWVQGERDCNESTWGNYFDTFTLVANLFASKAMQKNGSPSKLMIGLIGRSPTVPSGVGYIRQALMKFSRLHPTAMLGATHHDIPTDSGGVHLTGAGYKRYARRFARAILRDRGLASAGGNGPSISSGTRTRCMVNLQIQHAGGATLQPLAGIASLTGFEASQDGFATTIGISWAAITGPAQITLKLATLPTAPVSVRYMWGNGYDATNQVYDDDKPLCDALGFPILPTEEPVACG